MFHLLQNVARSLGAQRNVFVRRMNKIIKASRSCLKASSMNKVYAVWWICLRTLILADLGTLVSTMFQIIADIQKVISIGEIPLHTVLLVFHVCVQTLPPPDSDQSAETMFLISLIHSLTLSTKKMTKHPRCQALCKVLEIMTSTYMGLYSCQSTFR